MEDSKVALSYTQRYSINHYRKIVVALILQQCRISKISTSVINVLCTLLEQVLSHCLHTITSLDRERRIPCVTGLNNILDKLCQTFMSTTPRDFAIQQYIDYVLNHKRVNSADTVSILFGQKYINSIIPKGNIEIVDS
jgi:hypothetical protein